MYTIILTARREPILSTVLYGVDKELKRHGTVYVR